MEETGTSNPCIRQMQDKHSYGRKRGHLFLGSQSSNEATQHKAKDMYCQYCGAHGHSSATCKFMAKLIIANESLQKVDHKMKKELNDMFHHEQRRQQERKLKQKTHMIQQLLDTGGSRDDIEAILNTIPQEGASSPVDNDESSASESSHSA
jgi:hypothetical protein